MDADAPPKIDEMFKKKLEEYDEDAGGGELLKPSTGEDIATDSDIAGNIYQHFQKHFVENDILKNTHEYELDTLPKKKMFQFLKDNFVDKFETDEDIKLLIKLFAFGHGVFNKSRRTFIEDGGYKKRRKSSKRKTKKRRRKGRKTRRHRRR